MVEHFCKEVPPQSNVGSEIGDENATPSRLDSTQTQVSVWAASRYTPGGFQPLSIPHDEGREQSKRGEQHSEKNAIQRDGFPPRESFGANQG